MLHSKLSFSFFSSRNEWWPVSSFLLHFPTQLKCASINTSGLSTKWRVKLLKQTIYYNMASRKHSRTQRSSSGTLHMNASHRQTQKHSKERNHYYSECGRSFTAQSNVKKHQRIHTGEKPYNCLECGKSFAVLGNLKIHHSYSHTREALSLLRVWSFTDQSNLKTHRRIHTDNKHCIFMLSSIRFSEIHELLQSRYESNLCSIRVTWAVNCHTLELVITLRCLTVLY